MSRRNVIKLNLPGGGGGGGLAKAAGGMAGVAGLGLLLVLGAFAWMTLSV